MKRTTIMADEELLDRLRAAARREGRSLAEIIREGLLWRAERRPARLRFIGAAASSSKRTDTARRAGTLAFGPRSWR
jgi:ribbon-helix-helix CopG family protein